MCIDALIYIFFFREYFNVLGIMIDFFCKTSVLKATKTMTKAIEKKRSIFINRRCKKKDRSYVIVCTCACADVRAVTDSIYDVTEESYIVYHYL